MASNSAWGIEVGSYALKAIRLERSGDEVSVADFFHIPHKKVLTTPDVDNDEMVRLALGQFMSQQPDLRGGPVLISVPGNGAFARFAKLPPVEPKKIPDIVKFEAVQQIPFPIEEVEWDYETFSSPGSPEVEVGIFAITKAAVQQRLNLYGELGLFPDGINISPVAVFNAIRYDFDLDENSPGVIILDIGTASTDLIIAERGRTWIRTFPIGGHNFTESLISAFKLTYSKAEKLKQEAQTSKYRRQILSAMRPVFADLAQEVQRSIGYYHSMHRDAELTRLVGVGSTFRLPGLRKFLSQQVQLEISRLDEFRKIPAAPESSLAEHSVNAATCYGLALQGLDLSGIDVNLIPVPVVRDRLWSDKVKWFGAAAALVVFGSMIAFTRPIIDSRYTQQPADRNREIEQVISEAQRLKNQLEEVTRNTEITARPLNVRGLLANRDVWPQIVADVSAMLSSADPQPELFSFDPEVVKSIPPGERRLLELKSVDYQYRPPSGEGGKPKLTLTMVVETSNSSPEGLANRSIIRWLEEHAKRPGVGYRVVLDGGREMPPPRIVRREPLKTPPAEVGSSAPADTERRQTTTRSTGRTRGPDVEYGHGHGLEGSEHGFQVEGPRIGGQQMSGPVRDSNLDAVAPLPKPVAALPPETDYFRLTLQWTIELLPAEDTEASEAGSRPGEDY